MLILTIAEYFHKLLEDCCLAAIASLSELCRVMVVAVNLAIMLIIAVLGAKYRWTHRTGKMIYVILAIKCCDI